MRLMKQMFAPPLAALPAALVRAMVAVLSLAAAAILVSTPGHAQQGPVFEPVIVVNDRAITEYEIAQRARFLAALGAGGDIRGLARQQLIDERLKQTIIDRLDQNIGEQELQAAITDYARQRELEPEQLVALLAERGIAEATLSAFIRSGTEWRNVVQGLFRVRATPSEQDLDTALDFANRQVEESVLLQELTLSIEALGETEATELATDLSRSLNRGGNFTAAVRRYSAAASAQRDGNLPWTSANQLPRNVAVQVLALQPGEVTAPVPIRGGLSIYKLLGLRETPRSISQSAADTVTYYVLRQSVPSNAAEAVVQAAEARARSIQASTRLCGDLDDDLADFDTGSGRSEPSALGTVPQAVAQELATMAAGDIRVLRQPGAVDLLMLCARSGETSPEEREALRRQLFNQRLTNFAEAFLEDLRGDAVIEER